MWCGESRARLAALAEQSLAGVRAASEPVIALSPQRRAEIEGLQDYLFANVYRHPRVMAVMAGAEAIVRDLFARYMARARRDAGAVARGCRGRRRGGPRGGGGRFRRRHDRPLCHQGAPAPV